MDDSGWTWGTAVAAGAAWLDETVPGWEARVTLETLDLWHPDYCILGQAFPIGVGDCCGYHAGQAQLGDEDRVFDLGFSLPAAAPRSEWEALTEAWRGLITARRNAA